MKVAEDSSGEGSISEEYIPFQAQDIYNRLHDAGTVISRGQADSNVIMSPLECYLVTKVLIAVGGAEGLLTLKRHLQHLRDPQIGVQRLDTVTNILLSLDGLERQEEAIIIQRRFALMELAAKHRKYMNGKTRSKIRGKAYKRMTNERLGLTQAPSMQMSADEQSLATNQVVMSKWQDTKEHIKDQVIVGQRWLKLSNTFGPTVLLLIPTTHNNYADTCILFSQSPVSSP